MPLTTGFDHSDSANSHELVVGNGWWKILCGMRTDNHYPRTKPLGKVIQVIRASSAHSAGMWGSKVMARSCSRALEALRAF